MSRRYPPFQDSSVPQPAPLRNTETFVRCPVCPEVAPGNPAGIGLGLCHICNGAQAVVRWHPDGRYVTAACTVCLDGKCRLCRGTGLVKASVACAWRFQNA